MKHSPQRSYYSEHIVATIERESIFYWAVLQQSKPMREFVYMILAEGSGRVKIGQTANVDERLAGLAAGSPYPLRLLCQFPSGWICEGDLHIIFEELRVHGEWFEASPVVMRLAETFAAGDEEGCRDLANDLKKIIHEDQSPEAERRRRREYARGRVRLRLAMEEFGHYGKSKTFMRKEVAELLRLENWTQRDLEDQLQISRGSVSRWVTGAAAPSEFFRIVLNNLLEDARELAVKVKALEESP